MQCLLTIDRESCYCGKVYSTNYGCKPAERGGHIPINSTDCMNILETGVYHIQYFTITGIKPNKPRMTTYISKGDRDNYGTCYGVNYQRDEVEYEYSYKRSTATILIQEIHLETTTGLTPKKSPIDVVLPGNLQLPITDKEAMSPLFGTIAWEIPELGCSASQMSNEYLEIFQGVVTVHKKLEVEGKSLYKDALITHYADSRAPDQISFGFSIRHEVEIYDIKAYQNNDQDISIIFLDRFDWPYEFATDVELTRPHLTNAKTVATGMHIKNAFNGEQTAKELYDANCKTEIKTIRNL